MRQDMLSRRPELEASNDAAVAYPHQDGFDFVILGEFNDGPARASCLK